jgi:hypothetical protein
MKMTMMSIEDLWRTLGSAPGPTAQTRVDASHPHDIYADVEPPGRVGLVVVCTTRPPDVRPLRSLLVERGKRSDGRWALRLTLLDRQLLPVFAALCTDIIGCTRSGVHEALLGQIAVQRLVHWRNLMEKEPSGLGDAALRGLIGELLVLRDRMLPTLGPGAAVGAWRGPLGAPQDFVLPDNARIEVKTIGRQGDQVRINGLGQLDPGEDPLTLIIVRTEGVEPDARGAVTAPRLIADLDALLSVEPEAAALFRTTLGHLGWHEHSSHEAVALRLIGFEEHAVGNAFPRLTAATVPPGVIDVDYAIMLPSPAEPSRGMA